MCLGLVQRAHQPNALRAIGLGFWAAFPWLLLIYYSSVGFSILPLAHLAVCGGVLSAFSVSSLISLSTVGRLFLLGLLLDGYNVYRKSARGKHQMQTLIPVHYSDQRVEIT